MNSSNRWADGDPYYHSSSSPSTESDSFTEHSKSSKSVDTVSKLFSSLLKSSECSLNTDSKSPTFTGILQNDLQTISTERCPLKNSADKQEPVSDSAISKDRHHLNEETNVTQSVASPALIADGKPTPSSKKSFAASSETVVIDQHKDHCTPSGSRIPVPHPRSDPLDYYAVLKKHQSTGLKLVNTCSLKRICSNSKIPVAMSRPHPNVSHEKFNGNGNTFFNQLPHHDRTGAKKNEKCATTGKYNHVKSKLAAYINRPMKTDCPRSIRPKSPSEKKPKNDSSFSNFSGIKRISSRTSLDTYTCDYKLPLLDINCSDCGKSEDATKNYQKAREHFELAIEHNRIKMENEKIIVEHWRIIEKHRHLVLEHEEKANEHTLKAMFHVLNRIT